MQFDKDTPGRPQEGHFNTLACIAGMDYVLNQQDLTAQRLLDLHLGLGAPPIGSNDTYQDIGRDFFQSGLINPFPNLSNPKSVAPENNELLAADSQEWVRNRKQRYAGQLAGAWDDMVKYISGETKFEGGGAAELWRAQSNLYHLMPLLDQPETILPLLKRAGVALENTAIDSSSMRATDWPTPQDAKETLEQAIAACQIPETITPAQTKAQSQGPHERKRAVGE